MGGQVQPGRLLSVDEWSAYRTLQAAGLWFFAFAGYARLATLGEEVIDPARTIPKAIPLALGLTLVTYVLVVASVLMAVDVQVLARSPAPLAAAVEAGSLLGFSPVVRAGAAIASLAALLSLIVGVSRTTFAMADNGDLPRVFAAVHPRYHVPHRADLLIGAVVCGVLLIADVREAIGFSSFAVLTYYAIANAAALRLRRSERRWPRMLAWLGLLGCLLLAFSLPLSSVISGVVVLLTGAVLYWLKGQLKDN